MPHEGAGKACLAIRPSKACSGKTIKCMACGTPTAVELIDGKDDGSGHYNRLECPRCYGPDWAPLSEHFVDGGWNDRRPSG